MLTPGSSMKLLRARGRRAKVSNGSAAGKQRAAGDDALGVAQLHDKGLDAVLLAVDDELGKDGAVGRGRGRAADPPLGRVQVRGVDDELVALRVERRRRLDASDVGAMGELRRWW
jgi:hypothetical protein